MEKIVNLHIEKLPEGVYLATSEDVPGLVAQGRTVTEVIEIGRDVAKKLIEAKKERDLSGVVIQLPEFGEGSASRAGREKRASG